MPENKTLDGKITYPVSQLSLSGEEGRIIRQKFWDIAAREFGNNRTLCFKAIVMEAAEKREKSKR